MFHGDKTGAHIVWKSRMNTDQIICLLFSNESEWEMIYLYFISNQTHLPLPFFFSSTIQLFSTVPP